MTSTDTVTGTPAAWYADPAGSPLLRWWDGSTWTAHTLDPSAPPAPTATRDPAPAFAPLDDPPYVPMVGFGPVTAAVSAPVAATYGAPTGSPLTPWVWLMAGFPVLQLVVALVVTGAFPDAPDGVLRYVFFSAAVVANLALAGRDAALLERRGYTAPRTRWAVIPLVYLIIRAVRVGRLSLWPLVVWTVTQLVLVTLVVLAVVLPLLVEGRTQAGYAELTPLTPEQRAAALTQSAMEETLLRDFVAAGFDADAVTCEPLTSTAPGSVALCVIHSDTDPLEVNAEVTGAEDPYGAFVVNGGRSLD